MEKPFRRRDLLGIRNLSADEIVGILDTAENFREISNREIKKVPTLRGKTVINLFFESSTRTRTSFELAAFRLSADVINISTSASSITKGETLKDTAKNLEALHADIIVIRHSSAGAAKFLADRLQSSVVNGGDGAHEHPTQALLDAYTLRKALGSLEGRRICIVGDIKHSRVARSNVWALTKLGAQVTLVGPRTLLPLGLNERNLWALPPVAVDDDLDRAIDGADALMALRIQQERMAGATLPSLREYARRYQVNATRLARAQPGAPVLHPGPMNEGIEIAPDVAHGPQSEVERQVEHGVAVRMAVLYLLTRSRA